MIDLLSHFRELFAYDRWSNLLMADALTSAPALPGNSMKLLAHIAGSQQVWLGRLLREESGLDPWPAYSIAESRAALDELQSGWKNYLEGLRPELLGEIISYKTTKGIPFATSIGDILTQVINHSTYHRAQIASALRREGINPPATDFILYAREGKSL